MDEQAAEGAAGTGRISRRALFKRAGMASVAVAVPAGSFPQLAVPAVEREQLQFFAADEATTVSAIVARLIPTDQNGPGAAEARVDRYIDRALAGELSVFRDIYTAGLAAVDGYASNAYGAPFASLPPDKQDAVLSDMEQNKATGFSPNSRTFFDQVREHTLQGMFGDPYHGGNANFVGWDLIGFAGIKLYYSAKDQQLDVAIKPAHKSTTDYKNFGRYAP